MKTVSLLTVSLIPECLPLLKERIRAQTYDTIQEWVIVAAEEKTIDGEDLVFPVVHVPYARINHPPCQGDIVVYVGETEWIDPDRVRYLVEQLDRTGADAVAYRSVRVYDFFLKKFFRSNDPRFFVHPQAWVRQAKIQEPTLIENIHLQTEIVFGHNHPPTWRPLLMAALINMNPEIEILSESLEDSQVQPYKDVLYREFENPYDIVYYLSGFHKPFRPDAFVLKGSEQMVVHLSETWARQGKKVAVYGNFPSAQQNKGVEYFPWEMFPFESHFKILILWNLMAIKTSLACGVYAETIWIDMHEPPLTLDRDLYQQLYKLPYIHFMVRGEYHLTTFEKMTGVRLDPSRYQIVPCGIQEDFLVEGQSDERQPLRFHFRNCYSKGLGPMLLHTWPVIKNAFFKAEFHVYGGMEFVPDPEFRTVMMELLEKTPGVYHHGLQDVRTIAQETRRSTFHLFLTNATNEIDGLTIRESIANGCIPLLSDSEFFRAQQGIHFHLEDTSEGYRDAGYKIVDVIRNTDMEKFRRGFSPVRSWQQINVVV